MVVVNWAIGGLNDGFVFFSGRSVYSERIINIFFLRPDTEVFSCQNLVVRFLPRSVY